MEILIAREAIDKETLDALAKEWHVSLVKGVADISRAFVALGGEWHIDANNRLIEDGGDHLDVSESIRYLRAGVSLMNEVFCGSDVPAAT